MESRVHHTRLHGLRNKRAQHCIASTAFDFDERIMLDATFFCIVWVNVQTIFVMPLTVLCATRLCAHIVLRQDTPRR